MAAEIVVNPPDVNPDFGFSSKFAEIFSNEDGARNDYLTRGDAVTVNVTSTDVDATATALTDLGFELTTSRPDLFMIEGLLTEAVLQDISSSEVPGLLGILPIPSPYTSVGSVTSEADIVLETNRVRGTAPDRFDGAGVTIGVLSDSYDALGGAVAGIVSGDLPFGVDVIEDLTLVDDPTLSDEGRGMLELIHDLAPAADLAFATAFTGPLAFADNILALRAAGSDVIVDDIGYFTEPFFQDGIIAQAVDQVVAAGATYFSAAGNSADQSYETTSINFVNDTIGSTGNYLDFDPGPGVDTRQQITIPAFDEIVISLQWDDPFFNPASVDTDLNIQLTDPGNGDILLQFSNERNRIVDIGGIGVPVEFFRFTNPNATDLVAEISIEKFAGPDPGRIKYINFGGDSVIEFDTNSSTIFGHPAAFGGRPSVGAVPYFDQTTPEDFTSVGPSTILFDPSGTPLASADVRQTPAIAAIDGTNTTFFGGDADGDGLPNFFGTSAAAPHAAAVAALMLQADPTLTPTEVYDQLESTALDIGPAGVDNVTGAGVINAYDAIFGPAVPAFLPLNEGFESGVLSDAWETHSTGKGRLQVTGFNSPAAGAQHLTMDTFSNLAPGSPGLNEAILHVDTIGFTDVMLEFTFREFSDADDPMSAAFVGSENSDGVALSVDGTNWFRIVDLAGSTPTDTTFGPFDLTAIATANGVNLVSGAQIKFQQFGSGAIATDGFAFDDVTLSGTPTILSANITLDAGNNLIVTGQDFGGGEDITLQSDTTNNEFVISGPGHTLTTSIPGSTGSGSGTVTIPFSAVTGPDIIVNSRRGIDTLTVNYDLGNFSKEIFFDGGAPTSGSGDTLNIEGGGTFGNVNFGFIDHSSGTIDVQGNATINYTGLEPVGSTVTATNITLDYSDVDEAITLSQTTADTITVESTNAEVVTLTLPDGLLTINGNGGFDAVEVVGDVSVGATSLEVNSDDILIDAASLLTETGNVDLNADRNVTIANNGALESSIDGTLTIRANVGFVPTSGDFDGISLDSASIFTADGDILLEGRGGNDSASTSSVGIRLSGGTVIDSQGSASDAGAITLLGTGGDGLLGNPGIVMSDAATLVTSLDGDVSITGRGGGSDQSEGVLILGGSVVVAGSASIGVSGTGGFGTDQNIGVRLASADAFIGNFGSGNTLVQGFGDGIGDGSSGVQIDGGRIESIGTALEVFRFWRERRPGSRRRAADRWRGREDR